MEDLIQQLKEKAGLTEEQAMKSLHTIKDYIQSKLPPMMHGFIDNFLGASFSSNTANYADALEEDDITEKARKVAEDAKARINHIAEDTKGEVEDFAKEASEQINEWAVKTEEAAKEAMNKLKDMLGDEKKQGSK